MAAKTKTAPKDGVGVIDLDARRAARLEGRMSVDVKFGGTVWKFKPEIPMQVVEEFTDGNMVGAFERILIDPDQAEDFLAAADLSQNDMAELMRAAYGLDLGNS